MNKKVEMYCVEGHPACDMAASIFDAKGIEYQKLLVDTDMKLAVEMWHVPNATFCHRFLSVTIISGALLN